MTTATVATSPAGHVESDAARQRPCRMSHETDREIAESGRLRPEAHVVLLDGIPVQAMAEGPDRGGDVIGSPFMPAWIAPDGWHVRPEQPIVLRQGWRGDGAPGPDVAIAVGRNGQPRRRHPEAAEVGVMVEVASSAVAFAADGVGLRRHAHAAIPTAPIAALHDPSVRISTGPTGPTDDPSDARVEVERPGELLGLAPRLPGGGVGPAIPGPIAAESFFAPDL